MADHTTPSEPMLSQVEPVAVAEGARWVLGALIALGWIALPDETINAIITAVGAIASVVLTVWARRRVTPVAKLRPTAET